MADDGSDTPLDQRVRTRLRQLRTERGLTLQQVAEVANLDVSTLSRLESGKRRLAIDHLPGLAEALGVTLDELLGPAVVHDPRVRLPPRTRWGLTSWPLTHRGPAGGLHAYRFLVDPSRDTPPDPLPVHEGHDWMYVLSGRLRLLLGDDDLVIEPGEAVEFSTVVPHWFGAIDGPVELIAIFGPHGERVHLRR
ncbi:helix-turn-helix domain-containing protein [Nitriliruptor alkaliphilus]|uniref:helix-turn-helix domain-containing protein n=1 Tax=Nitriliruptor alkaliphilus TaxID=427918 RepID=UPI0006972573|nr:helix-turn-helix transcriptional regulator [Nitriliruptor alkaliphilus]